MAFGSAMKGLGAEMFEGLTLAGITAGGARALGRRGGLLKPPSFAQDTSFVTKSAGIIEVGEALTQRNVGNRLTVVRSEVLGASEVMFPHLLEGLTPELRGLLSEAPGGRPLLASRHWTDLQWQRFENYQRVGSILSPLDLATDTRLIPLERPGFFFYDGTTHSAVRNLRHVDQRTLQDMHCLGNSPKDAFGRQLQGHHHQQHFHREPGSMIVQIPKTHHKVSNPIQHPYGNHKGTGLTIAERRTWAQDRIKFNRELARNELERRFFQLESEK
jgi:hypothetical protein